VVQKGPTYVPKPDRFIAKVVILFLILFAATPFMFDIRIDQFVIESPFYWIYYTVHGLEISIGLIPRGMNAVPNPFWWMDWVMVVFMFVLVGHYRRWISEKTTKGIGWLSIGPGIVTLLVNGYSFIAIC